jgi:hypothetical protein
MNGHQKRIAFIVIFAIAMAYFEAAVVVYLRELHYPLGFSFPLRAPLQELIVIELFREIATILMLITVGAVAGRKFWEKFGYFIILFGVWDIFYYIWLKVTIGWPGSFLEWDVLFLIPVPWIGPVIAPIAISVLMIIIGLSITGLFSRGYSFRPALFTWLLTVFATALVLFSFMYDVDATLRFQMPRPYLYWLLLSGLTLYVLAYIHSYRKVIREK